MFKRILLSIAIVFTIVLACCSNRHLKLEVLDITKYKALQGNPSNPIIGVALLNYYPKPKSSNTSVMAVDLYVCRKEDSRDSMFVFDTDIPHEDANFNKDGDMELIINTHDIKPIATRSILVNLPKTFVIPDSIEYVFSKIYKVKED